MLKQICIALRFTIVSAAMLELATAAAVTEQKQSNDEATASERIPSGKTITPLASPGAELIRLNPHLADFPDFVAGQALSTATSPDHRTLLVLTSGFNRNNGANGKPIDRDSNEYVFIYDISQRKPKQIQVLQVPDTFCGLVFAGDGRRFFVSGGKDDNVHTFVRGASADDSLWREEGEPIALGHAHSLGLTPGNDSVAVGLAVTPDNRTLVIANLYNDSASIVDVSARRVRAEIDLRPGKENLLDAGIAGGEYPFWVVAKDNDHAYISSLRDREVDEIEFSGRPKMLARIKMPGNPNKMLLNSERTRLYVAQDNSDDVTVIDTSNNRIVENINTTAPEWLLPHPRYSGSAPNALALSGDEQTLYVSNGGTNCVAVVKLSAGTERSGVIGLIPTGWYPNAVSLGGDGATLYVANSKTNAGPNRDHSSHPNPDAASPGPSATPTRENEYILQLEKAGLLTVPLPDDRALRALTRQVGMNNGFNAAPDPRDKEVMGELRRRIRHVVYIIKENRTYDQVLGDLGRGNGDPALAEFGEKLTPSFHAIARRFVDLDNFYVSGEVSGDGWPWSTSGRESDYGEKAVVLNYAQRGTEYEYEGPNRDINVGLASLAQRKEMNPKTPDDPDLLPGASNVAAPDGPEGTPQEKGYIWDAVLRKGLTFREYGCMSDGMLNAPRVPDAFARKMVQSRPANPELFAFGDPYFAGFDPGYPDYYREQEWEREFDKYVENRDLPAFEIVQLPVDHMGSFDTALSKVNTPETQQADNDFATGKLIQRIANSPYKDSTLIFILEDDAQDGPDHVDAHRSTAYVVGPYVRQGAVVSNYYTTVNMIRTMEELLGLDHLNLNTATARPMTDVFDLSQKDWDFTAIPSSILLKTELPLSADERKKAGAQPLATNRHDAAFWISQTRGLDFHAEDRVDAGKFNRIVWNGLMDRPYPAREGE